MGFVPRVTLASLAQAPHTGCPRADPVPGPNSVAAPRPVDADINVDAMLTSRHHFGRNPTNRQGV